MVLRNILTSGSFNISAQLIIFAVEIAVARILMPDDFGLYAITIMTLELFAMFSFKSMAVAFVQSLDSNEQDLFAIAFFVFILSVIMCLILILFSSNVESLFNKYFLSNNTLIVWIIPILSLEYVYRMAMMKKQMYWEVGFAELLSVVVYSISVYMLSINEYGYNSLLIAYSLRCLSKFIIVIFKVRTVYSLLPELEFYRVLKYFKMTLGMTFQGVFLYSTSNADKYFANLVAGSNGLGIYSRAMKLVQMPLNQISRNISAVLFVEFSKIQSDLVLVKRLYEKTIFYLCLVFFIFSAFLSSFSESIVIFIYGEKWQGMASVLNVLVHGAVCTSISIILGDLLKSRGIVYRELLSNVICFLSMLIILIVVSDKFNLVGVAWAFVISQFIFLVAQSSIVANIINVSIIRNVSLFLIPFVISLFFYLYAAFLKSTYNDIDALVIFILTTLILIISICFILFRGLIK
ncbi:TPA: oligosaccharide flippase family protein [Vibrio cholerae]|uniref:oligosaccharide flippase family protein n=1 Tax=Vibrio cholerae TaxID=666 RepID=UPI0016527D17|nr:oligosaccharide flippase family protein [Vibrio cholerae]HAS3585105.1 oligosaccharide flippase family protein [Vibrio cholerae]